MERIDSLPNDDCEEGGWETVPKKRHRQRPPANGKQRNNVKEPSPPTIQTIPPTDATIQFHPFVLLLVGVPGSGKSTFAEMLVAGKPWKYVRISQDRLGCRRKCENLCRRILSEGKCPVIDRCNFDLTQRKHFLDIARERNVVVDCVVFLYPMEECVRRCEQRKNHETVDASNARVVVGRMVNDFHPPLPNRNCSEEFRNLRCIYEFQQSNDVALEYLSSIY